MRSHHYVWRAGGTWDSDAYAATVDAVPIEPVDVERAFAER